MPNQSKVPPPIPLRKKRDDKPNLTEVDQKVIVDGADKVEPLLASDDEKVRDFSVPLNEYYHRLLEEVAKESLRKAGLPTSKKFRRQIAATALREYLEKKKEEFEITIT